MSKPQVVESPLVDREWVAGQLDVCVRTVTRLDQTAMMPQHFNVGRAVRYRRTDIEAWIEMGCPNRKNFEAAIKAVA